MLLSRIKKYWLNLIISCWKILTILDLCNTVQAVVRPLSQPWCYGIFKFATKIYFQVYLKLILLISSLRTVPRQLYAFEYAWKFPYHKLYVLRCLRCAKWNFLLTIGCQFSKTGTHFSFILYSFTFFTIFGYNYAPL